MVSQIPFNFGDLDLYSLIFKEILKLQHCSGPGGWGCLTGEFTHDFLFNLFLPHIILVLFLYIAFKEVGGHRGLGTLLGIGGYIFIIRMEWYPAFASLSLLWLAVAIIFGFYHFIIGKFIPPGKEKEFYNAGKNLGKKLDDISYKRGDLRKKEYDRWRRRELERLKREYKEADSTEEKERIIKIMEQLKKE